MTRSTNIVFNPSFEASKDISGKSVLEVREAYTHTTDAELITLFISGKGEPFAALVDRHISMVHNFVYRYLQNADNTDDVVQEVFIKVWKNVRSFDQSKNFKTWLLTISKNTALDFIKKKKPVLFSKIEENDVDIDTFLAPFVDAQETAAQTLEKQYLKAEMDGLLEKLTPSYRTVLTMRYADQLKFREIAELLQEPIDTIKSKHRRALALLKSHIAPK